MDGDTTTPQKVNAPASNEQPIPAALFPVMPRTSATRVQIAARGTNIRPRVKIPKTASTLPTMPATTPWLELCLTTMVGVVIVIIDASQNNRSEANSTFSG